MKVLLVNKFLYPKGGAETYVFKLGDMLTSYGHEVQYFGLDNPKNTVGNSAELYVTDMDFSAGIRKNFNAPFRIIYSEEARRKFRGVLNTFQPDIVHLNNIQFHLTPSIILEAEKFRKKTGKALKIIYTAHDYQLICPSHGLFDTQINACEKCIGGNYLHCIRKRCVKNSALKSLLGAADAYFWKFNKAYSFIDTIICPSAFLKEKLDTQNRFADKTQVIHNFIEPQTSEITEKEGYVLEFGHLSKDKGTNTLLKAAEKMPEYRFVFAGFGKAEKDIATVKNADFVGFKTGDELKRLISKAAVSVYPSEWYENCPFSVIESQMYGTPVIGSKMGGIPELIDVEKTGLLFEAGNAEDLEEKLRFLLGNSERLDEYTKNCARKTFETPESYYRKLIQIYGE